MNDGLANRTLLLRIDSDGASDDARVPGALYDAGPLAGGAPKFDGSERWPVIRDALEDGASLDAPIASFPDGYVTSGVWVSGRGAGRLMMGVDFCFQVGAPFTEPKPPERLPFLLPIDVELFTLDLSKLEGRLGGVMDRAALQTMVAPLAVAYGTCPGDETFDQMVTTLTQAADVVVGAPNLQDTTRECDGLSIGLGLTMAPAAAPTVVIPPPTPLPSDCSATSDAGDAGADAAAAD